MKVMDYEKKGKKKQCHYPERASGCREVIYRKETDFQD